MSNPEIIVNILTQALSSTVHGPDFNLCLSLLREPSVCSPDVTKEGADEQAILHDTDGDEGDGGLESVMPWLQELHNLTRSCQFSKFWAEFNGSSEPAQRKFPLPPCFIGGNRADMQYSKTCIYPDTPT
jgi:translation initiation factor 3 subunit K